MRGGGLVARLRRGPSVLQLLLVLTLIPALGLPVFSWTFVHDRLRRSDDAHRVELGLQGLTKLDALRVATETESYGLIVQALVQAVPPTPAERAGVPAKVLTTTPAQYRAITDQALDAVAADPLVAVPDAARQVEAISRAMASIRSTAITSGVTGQLAFFRLIGSMQSYDSIIAGLQRMEQSAVNRISSGRLGSGGPGILEAIAQIRAVGDLVVRASVQHTEVVADGNGDVSVIPQLQATTGTVDTMLADLEQSLPANLRAQVTTIRTDPAIKLYQQSIQATIKQAIVDPKKVFKVDAATLHYVYQIAPGAIGMTEKVSALLASAIDEGVAVARHERSQAADRARNGIIGTVAALLATLVVLLLVGGTIRRRLAALAIAAQRLSAGQFELMDVRGPREVALASEGLNDAVHGLREITMKAGLIAEGNLTSPALEQPSPGPLGAALHASFERVLAVIRERESLQRQLAHDATHDGLTGLPNRSHTETLLAEALVRARDEGTVVALLFVDLDHFKDVNDSFGHHAGDQVLKVAALRMSAQLRTPDTVCRLGGDEFVAILRDTTAEAAGAVGRRIVDSVREPVPYRGRHLQVGASVGIAVYPDPDDTTAGTAGLPGLAALAGPDVDQLCEDLLGRADRAVYRAKASGRNTAAF